MKSSLLLGLILPGLLRASDTKYFVNGTLQPVTTFSNTEDIGNLQDKKNCTNSDFVENCVSIFLKNKTTGLMTQFAMRSDEVSDFEVPKVAEIGGFRLENITCFLTTELNCSWNAVNTRPGYRTTLSVLSRDDGKGKILFDQKDGGAIVYLQNKTDHHVQLSINVSSENFWYIHYWAFQPSDLVKLRPPQNISASVIEGKLHIKWDKPDPTIRNDCFLYQLRINKDDEVTDLEGVTKAERSVDLRKSNFVEMRVTTTVHCVQNHIWSDWSAAVEVPASERYLDELNPLVVAAIALGIPMFLLAILLACRCHSRMEKLFPVPSPSMKVKELLEKDNCIQVFPKYIEETTEVLIVGND
ncbi:uncharacterized protein LOC133117120 isoform X1 [Conger conger]|nr:uncharacterized protein LOC133117120 isoform X1 [Conger conger]XP_061083240.1 uncharacterized protein LOC133117120 isoform X1 [Conger conger]